MRWKKKEFKKTKNKKQKKKRQIKAMGYSCSILVLRDIKKTWTVSIHALANQYGFTDSIVKTIYKEMGYDITKFLHKKSESNISCDHSGGINSMTLCNDNKFNHCKKQQRRRRQQLVKNDSNTQNHNTQNNSNSVNVNNINDNNHSNDNNNNNSNTKHQKTRSVSPPPDLVIQNCRDLNKIFTSTILFQAFVKHLKFCVRILCFAMCVCVCVCVCVCELFLFPCANILGHFFFPTKEQSPVLKKKCTIY